MEVVFLALLLIAFKIINYVEKCDEKNCVEDWSDVKPEEVRKGMRLVRN